MERTGTGIVDIVIPVYNEQAALPATVSRLHAFLQQGFPWEARIIIADNASSDGTLAVARALAHRFPGVSVLHLDEKGRGRALKRAWMSSTADVCAYMDVDLSTDLSALSPLIAPLMSGHSSLAIGSRLGRGAHIVRGPRRDIISRCYNLLLRVALGVRFSDAQCGFKAIRTDAARVLLPHVHDDDWFFDTELLVLTERCGLRIAEVPVDWVDDPDSRVDVRATALEDLRGMWRIQRAHSRDAESLATLRAAVLGGDMPVPQPPLAVQVGRFAAIGVLSTLAYAILYLALRLALAPQVANFGALLLTAVVNTAANRRYTFAVRGRRRLARHHLEGMLVFGLGWAITASSLGALHLWAPQAGSIWELIVLTAANLAATLLRFVLFKTWVFRRRDPAPVPGPASDPHPDRQPAHTFSSELKSGRN